MDSYSDGVTVNVPLRFSLPDHLCDLKDRISGRKAGITIKKYMLHLDLFSGISGFSLAADRVWPDIEHMFCEIDPFCVAVLKKHWPTSKIYGDIRTLTNAISATVRGKSDDVAQTERKNKSRSSIPWGIGDSTGRVDLLTGGFPCQPFSQAGRRKGTADNDGNGDALPCGDGCGIIGLCNGDTTISVQDARRTQENGEGIANPVRPSTKPSGEPRTSNGSEETTGSGTSKRSTRFTNDMEGNATVVERPTLPFSQSTTSTAGATRNDDSTTAKRGNSSSRTDTPRPIKSSASTATTQSTTSEPVLINGERIFLLTGGFPCQPFSQAGKRKGTSDDRYLWPEMFAVIKRTLPRWVVAENVRGLVTWNDGMVLEKCCADLESIGYEVQPIIIPACAVNAPHRRDRVWIIGHAKHDGQHGSKNSKCCEARGYGNSEGSNELRQPTGSDLSREDATNTECAGHARNEHQTGSGTKHHRGAQSPEWSEDWPKVAARLCRLDDGLPQGVSRPKGWRNAAIKAYGNAIVPKVAEQIFRAIQLAERSKNLKEE